MVVPGKHHPLVAVVSVLLVFGGITISVFTEYTHVGVGYTIFGFVLFAAEAILFP